MEFSGYILGKGCSRQHAVIWKAFAQEALLKGSKLSLLKRLRVYLALANVPDAVAERSLIGYSIFPSAASKEWANLSNTGDELQKMAFDRDINEAIQILDLAAPELVNPCKDLTTTLLRSTVIEKLSEEARQLFLEEVLGQRCSDEIASKGEWSPSTYRKLFKYPEEQLGSDLHALLQALDGLSSPSRTYPDLQKMDPPAPLSPICDMIRATQLFVQLFPNQSRTSKSDNVPLSPPPSPSKLWNRQHFRRRHELRCLLGRAVFEQTQVEEARDTIVDMLTQQS